MLKPGLVEEWKRRFFTEAVYQEEENDIPNLPISPRFLAVCVDWERRTTRHRPHPGFRGAKESLGCVAPGTGARCKRGSVGWD